MNTFQGASGTDARPIRISYHRYVIGSAASFAHIHTTCRGNHYNSLRLLDGAEEDKTYAETIPPPALPEKHASSLPVGPQAEKGTAASGGAEGQEEVANVCFLCGQPCADYEELQIHMFTTCEKRDLL